MLNIDDAVQEARRRRAAHRQHYAVVQRGTGYSVMTCGNPDAFRAAWTTKDDCRDETPTMRRRCALEEADIGIILELRASGLKLRELADKFEVSISAISHVCAGRRWASRIAE